MIVKGFEAKNGHVRFHVLNKTSHEGHVGGKKYGFKTTYGAAMRKQLILEMLFKTQRVTGNSELFTNSRNKGREERNRSRALCRKKQTKHRSAEFRKTHTIICKKIKTIVDNGEIFLICRREKIKAPYINIVKKIKV
jgi:hypothetical protein